MAAMRYAARIMIRTTRLAPIALLGLALTLAGCNSAKKPPANSLDAMDNELVDGTATNESGTAGLRTAIKVDRARTGKAKTAAVTENGGVEDCVGRTQSQLAYGNGWAAKLPADMPIHPQAQLEEAAGHDGACALRVVSFSVPAEREAVLAFYEDKAQRGGWSADRTTRGADWMLAGTKGDAAYTIIAGPAKNGATPVDYIWTSGAE